ncbi:MAG: SagB/ThcOx family dehydrogenase [Planctomycetes bacterium]|nr:SagB/ThcOx family dehydrogenase [Planctomycetota bacterium]MBI3834331.1 SagB/ThcOx family dehydrogenase [Planctomycetota bacterium]
MDGWQRAAEYHQQTKHYIHHFARSLGYLDWVNQPNPFRRFEGAPTLPLLIATQDSGPTYDSIFQADETETQQVNVHSLSAFFQFSMAIAAWKEYRGSRWALRVNPSSGNLHPTEAYLIAGPVTGFSETPGVFHYAPADHLLERRAEIASAVWRDTISAFPESSFLVGLTSIVWREVWKYGERGFRYCQHDVGHAFAAIALSAAHLGWQVRWLDGLGDDDLRRLLGLNRESDFADAESEHPDLLAVVIPQRDIAPIVPRIPSTSVIDQIAGASWLGKANRLSHEHVDWEWVKIALEACVKPRNVPQSVSAGTSDNHSLPDRDGEAPVSTRRISARRIFVQRRSGVAFDGTTSISASQFYGMLTRVVPGSGRVPWNVMQSNSNPNGYTESYVHLLLFVHRVEGLEPGLYFLIRGRKNENAFESIRSQIRDDFLWQRPMNCPDELSLFALQYGDARKLAAQVSCGQEIAGDGCFAVSMIAEFEGPLQRHGAWFYRRLHWETGMIGQVLYLEAEATGVRATGIGCYFDDPVHDLLGLKGMAYQALYHFTIGGAVEDERLTTLPPYGEEIASRRASLDES